MRERNQDQKIFDSFSMWHLLPVLRTESSGNKNFSEHVVKGTESKINVIIVQRNTFIAFEMDLSHK